MAVAARRLGWILAGLACAFGASRGWGGLGPALLAIVEAFRLRSLPHPRRHLRRLAFAALCGAFLESSAVAFGFYGYAAGWPVWWIAPGWVIAIWVIGAELSTDIFGHAPAFSWKTPVFGMILGVSNFAMCLALGVSRFIVPLPVGFLFVGLLWALCLPLLLSVWSDII